MFSSRQSTLVVQDINSVTENLEEIEVVEVDSDGAIERPKNSRLGNKRSKATLRYSILPKEVDELNNDGLSLSPDNGHPAWVLGLRPHFDLKNINQNKRKFAATMTCILCEKSITGKGAFNFVRHLQVTIAIVHV